MTEKEITFLREQAARCRRLARNICDREAQRVLLEMAEEYENEATAAESPGLLDKAYQ